MSECLLTIEQIQSMRPYVQYGFFELDSLIIRIEVFLLRIGVVVARVPVRY